MLLRKVQALGKKIGPKRCWRRDEPYLQHPPRAAPLERYMKNKNIFIAKKARKKKILNLMGGCVCCV